MRKRQRKPTKQNLSNAIDESLLPSFSYYNQLNLAISISYNFI